MPRTARVASGDYIYHVLTRGKWGDKRAGRRIKRTVPFNAHGLCCIRSIKKCSWPMRMVEGRSQEVIKTQAISPKLGEFLVKATPSKDIDDAFYRIFSDYLALKIASLAKTSEKFKRKWGMDFDEFQKDFKEGTLKKDTYAFDTEQDFWEWEETETLKGHYQTLADQWI